MYPLIVDLHTASPGNILILAPVINDLMRHPVPPQVARCILRPQDDRFSLPGLDTRLCTADTIVGNMSDMILDFYIFFEGDLTKIGLLLADLAPSPYSGDALPMEMTRSLLQCYSGTVCSFQNLLRCLKRCIYEHDSEERLISVIAGHLLPS